MSKNPNKGQKPDPADKYGGYTGYTPSNPAEDPYGAYSPPQQDTSSTAAGTNPDYVYGSSQAGQQQQQYSAGQQQQYSNSTYVPPQSVRGNRGNSGANDASSLGTSGRTAAMLSYLLLCFSGIVIFFLERKNRFVRFHAAQSIVLFGPVVIVYVILQFLINITSGIIVIGALIGTVFGCLSTLMVIVFGLLWLFMLIQSYRGVRVKLPFVGNYAESLLARFSGKGSI